jgi:hypothetical protein
MSVQGRQRSFAASGSSRWPGLVAELVTRQRAPPPPNVKFLRISRDPGHPFHGIADSVSR